MWLLEAIKGLINYAEKHGETITVAHDPEHAARVLREKLAASQAKVAELLTEQAHIMDELENLK